MKRIDVIIASRSDLIQASVLKSAFAESEAVEITMIHTGEGVDPEYTPQIQEQLSFGPDEVLPGEGYQGSALFGEVMTAYEQHLQMSRPDTVLLLGNSESAAACALAAARQGAEIIHMDAGNRHYDKRLRTEQNDLIIDQLSHYMVTTNAESVINLVREGVDSQQVVELGSLTSDAVFLHLGHAEDTHIHEAQGLVPGNYILVILEAHFDEQAAPQLASIFHLLDQLSAELPVHVVLGNESMSSLENMPEIDLEPNEQMNIVSGHGYHEMLKLMKYAAVVLTDSQSVQEETTVLGAPCLTLGYTTNRPVTLAKGTNLIVGYDAAEIGDAIKAVLSGDVKEAFPIDTWDGKVASRLVEFLSKKD